MVQPLQKTAWHFLKKPNTELPRASAVPLLGIHSEELKTAIQTDPYVPPLTTALFTILETTKVPIGTGVHE